MKLAWNMSNEKSNLTDQQSQPMSSTNLNTLDTNAINHDQTQQGQTSNVHLASSRSPRRLPLPTKLSFEQNLTNLIEKESPLLQSELLTAEHELSVLRSRLAVNEGVTAITGTILESLKGQFEAHHRTKSPRHSSAKAVEIHYDSQSPKSPYLVLKAINSFWIAQPIDDCDVEKHLKNFSSPVMKRATLQSASSDSDSEKETSQNNNRDVVGRRSSALEQSSANIDRVSHSDDNSISEEDEKSTIDRHEQLSEMKTIRSSSIVHPEQSFDAYEQHVAEIHALLNEYKQQAFTSDQFMHLSTKVIELKFFIHLQQFSDEEKMRIESDLDSLIEHILQSDDDEQAIDFFERSFLTIEQRVDDLFHTPPNAILQLESMDTRSPPIARSRLIPEDPVITHAVFFEEDHRHRHQHVQKKSASPSHPRRLIPEDARINAENFYEGDHHRSMYHPEAEKSVERVPAKQALIPERPLVSSDVFDEGDAQRSLFTERSSISPPPPLAIDNLREIMSDLMLAASWSRRPANVEPDEEIHAESFITTEERHAKKSVCEIIHEIENFPLPQLSITIDDDFEAQLIRTSTDLVDEIPDEAKEILYYQAAVQIVDDVLENIQNEQSDDEEEEEELITDVTTSRSTQELSHLVQELQTLEQTLPRRYSVCSSSSSDSDLSLPEIVSTQSFRDLNSLVSELEHIEDQLEDQLSAPVPSLPSLKSVNELGGLIDELNRVTKRINSRVHEEIFTSSNIDALSHDLSQYRRDSLSQMQSIDHHMHSPPTSLINSRIDEQEMDHQSSENDDDDDGEELLIRQMVEMILREAQEIIVKESTSNNSGVPTIVVDHSFPAASSISISDDIDLTYDDYLAERRTELADQLDYLRRMSRYDNDVTTTSPIDETPTKKLEETVRIVSKQHSSQSDLHIKPSEDSDFLLSQQQPSHFQSAYDLHDEEKSQLVRSPELYNIDHVTHHKHRHLLSSAIQYRTLSDSALTTDDPKRNNLTTTGYETSDEFLTIISKDNSCESMQQRHSTPYDDAMEKESSPEHSESCPLPSSAFSDTLEPTSSCRRPLAFNAADSSRMELELNIVAHELVDQVINDVVIELNNEHEESSSSTSPDEQLSSSSLSSDDDIPEEDEDEEEYPQIHQQPMVSDRPSFRLSMNKTLRRAQTNTDEFDIQQSPINLIPPLGRRSSQSDTESYFRAISPSTQDFSPHEQRTLTHTTVLDDLNKESDEIAIVNSLQEGILRRNLQSSSMDQETIADRRIVIHVIEEDDNRSALSQGNSYSMDIDIRQLLDDLLDSLADDLSLSISSEPLSSHSDATTVIFNSKAHSMDDDEDNLQSVSIISSQTLGVHRAVITSSHSSSSSSSSSSDSVIRVHRTPFSVVHSHDRAVNSMPSLNKIDSFDHLRTKRTLQSSPGSFEDAVDRT